ncbi:MAG: peptide ABC transporter substrate-binding protein [Acidimicrobiia bacterium]
MHATRPTTRPTWLALVVTGALVASVGLTSVATAATASGSKAAAASRAAGTITVGAEEFPPVLNNMTPQGNGQWTGMITGPALARGYKLLPDFSYQPWIFDKDCAVTTQTPFTVSCTIRSNARWSDGVPISSTDFKFTYDTIMNEKNDVVSRNGYDKITAFNVISPTEFQMVFDDVFAPFRDLWASTSTTVLPQHILEGTNFNKVWNDCICDPKTKQPIASGPMMVQSFKHDTEVTLVPNPNYWGTKASVAKVVFVPSLDSSSEINAFRAGEVDMIYPQNQIGLRKKIESVEGARYVSSLGPQWEHFDMLSTVKGFDDLTVRKAIATALPRQQIVDRVVKDANDDVGVLDNVMWMSNQPAYVAHWSVYPPSGDLDAAKQMLDAAGWKVGSDGVRAKNGVKLSFTLGTTPGNQARELAEQIIQEQMKQIGIKFTIKNSSDILWKKMTGFDYQALIYAWVGSPDPYSNNSIWLSSSIPERCTPKQAKADECDYSGQNYTRTSVPAVDAALDAADRESDPVKRAALYNEADQALATDGVTVIPLFQKPTQLGYTNAISGVKDNPTVDGFTWNIEDWTLAG